MHPAISWGQATGSNSPSSMASCSPIYPEAQAAGHLRVGEAVARRIRQHDIVAASGAPRANNCAAGEGNELRVRSSFDSNESAKADGASRFTSSAPCIVTRRITNSPRIGRRSPGHTSWPDASPHQPGRVAAVDECAAGTNVAGRSATGDALHRGTIRCRAAPEADRQTRDHRPLADQSHRGLPIHHHPEYDDYYVRYRSLFMDVAILLHTLLFAARGV